MGFTAPVVKPRSMQVGIVAQRSNPRAAEVAVAVRDALDEREVTVLFDDATAESLDRPELGMAVEALADCDLGVSIGGDGTFLFAARGADATPVMGVNLGEVGFLNAVAPADAVDAAVAAVERIRETGAPRIQELPRVAAGGDGWSLPPALNEVGVLAPERGRGGGFGVEVRVDGSLYTGGHADGVLVATPTGSTAYNLSEDGPLVHPTVSGLVVTEMCAAEPMPSLVADLEATVEVHVDAAEAAHVVADGRTAETVAPPTRVRVEAADQPVRIAGPPLDFFQALGKLD